MAGTVFDSPMDKYIQFNFQRSDHIDAMLKVLEDQTGEYPRTVVLLGELGIGREYFVEAVGYLAQGKGVKVHIAPIDLDGYANDGTTLEEYANRLLANQTERDRSRVWEIIRATQPELKAKAQFWVCALLSLEVSLKIPLRKLWESMHDLSGPNRPGYELLDRLIHYLTQDAKLVLHVRDNDLLTTTWRRWLRACLDRHSNLVLAFSSDSVRNFRRSDSDIKFAPLTFGPHDHKTFRSVIDSRFAPNTFPDGLYAVLWRYSSGYPEDMARVLGDLVGEHLVLWDGEYWRLADEGLESDRFAGVFAPEFYEPFDALREQLSSDVMSQLDQFMCLAAMCGTYVPSNLIMESTGLSVDERDVLGDLIDDKLVENTNYPVFEDLQAAHPSFNRVSVYRWRNRTLRRVFLKQLHAAEHAEQAAKLIAYLKVHLPVTTRGIAKLFLELSRFLPTEGDGEIYRNSLAWWIGLDEADYLAEQLSHDAEAGRLTPHTLWSVVVATERTWPAYRRFAALEALEKQRGGIPHELQNSFYDVKAELLHQLARYPEAEEILRATVARKERSLGPDHPHVGASLNNLARLLIWQGKYKEAELLCRRALAILEKSVGADHPDVALCLTNLVQLLNHQGKYSEADPLCRRALAILEESLGADRPCVAINLQSLAFLLDSQGKYDEAELFCRRSLSILEGTLVPDHRDLSAILTSLSLIRAHQGKYEEAELLCRRAVVIVENAMGQDHPDVGGCLHNLALHVDNQGRYEEAEALCRRALAILEKSMGLDHPSVSASLGNLAAVLHDQGKYKEAEPLHRRALAIREKALGLDHPDVATSLGNLAAVLRDQGKYDEAEPLARRALAIGEKALGPDHPDVAASLNNLAEILRDQGKYDEAEPLARRALAIGEKALGPDHPDVAASLNNLAEILRDQGKYDEAEPLARRALAIGEKALGPDHPDVAASLNNLAEILRDQGKYDEAEPLARRALAIGEKALGPDHPHVALSLNNLALVLRDQGKYEEAEPLHRRALAIREKARKRQGN